MADSVKQRSAKGPKRRNERNTLTFYEKIAVIRYYDESNISRNSLSKMFHCCATQIRRILERKEELLQQLNTLSETDASVIIEEMTRKRRKFEMSAISFLLHQWVERCRKLSLSQAITNSALKETALKMAAILNLPAFRPSYRWLNRFRAKYKYTDQDLSTANDGNECLALANGELSVEDIIIEFKDTLPSFMQKEIAAITATHGRSTSYETKCDTLSNFKFDHSAASELSEENEMMSAVNNNENFESSNSNSIDTMPDKNLAAGAAVEPDTIISAGTSALLNGVFPHLAVIHQFALLNCDVHAIELISQLGVHMQTQAAEGAYKQLSLATNPLEGVGTILGDIDDIVLIEQ